VLPAFGANVIATKQLAATAIDLPVQPLVVIGNSVALEEMTDVMFSAAALYIGNAKG